VQRLGNHDAGSDGEDVLAANKRCSTEVCACANTLEDGAQSHEAGNIGHRERVLARRDRDNACRLNSHLKQLDVGTLVRCNELQVQEEVLGESGVEEVLQRECSEGFLVECIFKMFELDSRKD